jgi:hypothetical protein
MKINCVYNEIFKNVDIDPNKKLGIILQELLEKCMLIIYNIEYSEIKIKDLNEEEYIIGSDELTFDITLIDFLNKINKSVDDIENIIIYDRKRDLNGNVIKNNIIIDRYVKWNNEFENNILNSNFYSSVQRDPIYNPASNSNRNRHIIRYPLDSLLSNILNISYNNLNYDINPAQVNNNVEVRNYEQEMEDNNNEEIKDNNEQDLNDNNEVNIVETEITNNENDLNNNNPVVNNEEESYFINNNQRIDYINEIIDNQYFNQYFINGFLNNTEDNNLYRNYSDVSNVSTEVNNNQENNISPYRRYFNNNANNNNFNNNNNNYNYNNNIGINNNGRNNRINENSIINNFINIFETITQNMNNIPYNDVNNFRDQSLQEDVKIILTEDEFNNIETFNYNEINKTEKNIQDECLICTECFIEDDELKKIKCNHVFHTECIKPWLCEENKKCPICRVDAGEGIIK